MEPTEEHLEHRRPSRGGQTVPVLASEDDAAVLGMCLDRLLSQQTDDTDN